MIAFINVDYSKTQSFWTEFCLKKTPKTLFLVCATRGYTFCGMRGYGVVWKLDMYYHVFTVLSQQKAMHGGLYDQNDNDTLSYVLLICFY